MKAILRAHVERVEPGKIYYETLDGRHDVLAFDFAMLLPPFRGADLKAYGRAGADITAGLFASSGFLKVDADYTAKPASEWRAEDWPQTYHSPRYASMFGIGIGIAFAPPHAISTPPGPAPAAWQHSARTPRPWPRWEQPASPQPEREPAPARPRP